MEMGNLPEQRKAYENEVKKTADSGLSRFLKAIICDEYVLDANDIIRSDADEEDNLRHIAERCDDKRYEGLERTKNSSLRDRSYMNRITGNITLAIKGIINGKKIRISHPEDSNEFKGTVDGQNIPKDDAEKIWNKYIKDARERSERLENVKERKPVERMEAVWKAKAEKKEKKLLNTEKK